MQYVEWSNACRVILKIQEFRNQIYSSFLSENVWFITRTVLKVREFLNILATKKTK